jgi:hypothetical protein
VTQAGFITMLESHLALCASVPYDRSELLAWVAAMWPHIEDDPDAGRWAGEFIEARRSVSACVENIG